VIAEVKARDLDVDENARVRYELQTTTGEDVLHVDRRTGELTLSTSDVIEGELVAVITAVDHGSPPLSATALLTVKLSPTHRLMTSSGATVGVSVYVTSAVCVGCLLVAVFLLVVAVRRRRRRHGDRAEDPDDRLQQLHDTAHMLGQQATAKPRPLRDLEPHPSADDVTVTRSTLVRVHVHSAVRLCRRI